MSADAEPATLPRRTGCLWTSRRTGLTLGVFSLTLAYYLLARPPYHEVDGENVARLIDAGEWSYHHRLFLPVHHPLVWLVHGSTGLPTLESLAVIDCVWGALAAACVFAAAALLFASDGAALLAAALFATAPAVQLFATTAELNAASVATASWIVLWMACSTGRRPSALAALVLVAFSAGIHLTGAMLAPAVAVHLLRASGRWAWPRHLGAALGLAIAGVAAAVVWRAAHGPAGGGAGVDRSDVGLVWAWEVITRLLSPPPWAWLVDQTMAPMGVLLIAFPCAVWAAATRQPAAVPLLLVLATVTIAASHQIVPDSKGCYFLVMYPAAALAVAGAATARPWPRARPLPLAALALALIAGQVSLSFRFRHASEFDECERDALRLLRDETQDRGLFLALRVARERRVQKETRLGVVTLETFMQRPREEWPALADAAVALCRQVAALGQPIAVDRALIETDFAPLVPVRDRILGALADLRPGRSDRYSMVGRVK